MLTLCKTPTLMLYAVLFLYACTESKPKENINKIQQGIPQVEKRDSIVKKESIIVDSKQTQHLKSLGLINVKELESSIQIELKYATTDNFTKTILYDSISQAFLHPIAANKLQKAQTLLKEIQSNYSLLVYDAARPMSVQKKMYNVVKNTPYHAYVANPSRTGMHNYGMAVDLTICDENNIPLDMGTPFDFFGRAAGINKEKELIAQGVLTKEQVDNRLLLRKIMTEAGFIPIRGEWWHFNASSLNFAKENTSLIE